MSGEHLFSKIDALSFCEEIIASGQSFVIEEKCVGQEFSLLSFSDGRHLVHMPAVQDHKRANVGDTGPNTGGMGSYSCANHRLPFLADSDLTAAQRINEKVVSALREKTGQDYIGILYGGYMATESGVKVIEFNARFGDPEAVNVLALLETDFVAVCQAMVSQRLRQLPISFESKATVCKYMVPEGYPDNPVRNELMDVSALESLDNIYPAAINEFESKWVMTGSRAAAVLGVAGDLVAAEEAAEKLAKQIKGKVVYRSDIGTTSLINQRISHMNELRKTNVKLLT